jgi:hypothetical protein
MTYVAQTTESLENDLTHSISGYLGYDNADNRQKTNRKLKEFLSQKLQQVEINLSRFEHQVYQQYETANLNPFHRISLSLKMLIQSLSETSPDNDQFFSDKEVNSDKISQLHEYDGQLVNQVEILLDEAQDLDNINGEYEIDQMLNHVYDLLDGVNQTMSEREFLIMSE